ncbi:hypothetical protein F5Y19DRAFT_77980 [Xylariaceae sp. FL1651]|nr:hypothetical protein F5Y19DRAFT_77980 [Xylariaceae sp. FL1651]
MLPEVHYFGSAPYVLLRCRRADRPNLGGQRLHVLECTLLIHLLTSLLLPNAGYAKVGATLWDMPTYVRPADDGVGDRRLDAPHERLRRMPSLPVLARGVGAVHCASRKLGSDYIHVADGGPIGMISQPTAAWEDGRRRRSHEGSRGRCAGAARTYIAFSASYCWSAQLLLPRPTGILGMATTRSSGAPVLAITAATRWSSFWARTAMGCRTLGRRSIPLTRVASLAESRVARPGSFDNAFY